MNSALINLAFSCAQNIQKQLRIISDLFIVGICVAHLVASLFRPL